MLICSCLPFYAASATQLWSCHLALIQEHILLPSGVHVLKQPGFSEKGRSESGICGLEKSYTEIRGATRLLKKTSTCPSVLVNKLECFAESQLWGCRNTIPLASAAAECSAWSEFQGRCLETIRTAKINQEWDCTCYRQEWKHYIASHFTGKFYQYFSLSLWHSSAEWKLMQ